MRLTFSRTLRAGFKNFYRNGWLSVATISIIAVTLFIINIQFAVVISENLLLNDIKDRVSISAYFKPDTTEQDVLKAKEEFAKYQEVGSVEYISKEQALEDFKRENADNEILQKSLEEIESNPFEPTLSIKAWEPKNYELIARLVNDSNYKEMINTVNYDKYSNVIDSLGTEIDSNQKTGLALGITLAVIAVLITFNSIRITMYAFRREIEIMRLVGASNNYILMPFVWEGILYGLISAMVALPLSFIYLKFVAITESSGVILPFSSSIYIDQFLNQIFFKNILWIVPAELGVGILLGVISSIIAIGRYLKNPRH